jgi:hypothetical protein
MEKNAEVVERLGKLETLRQAVRTMEQALALLTPEERLVLEMTVINPKKGAVQKLCHVLGVEASSVYRRRKVTLKKLETTLWLGEKEAQMLNNCRSIEDA